jgi:hypothetical protein
VSEPMKSGDLDDAERWGDVPVAVRSLLASLPPSPMDFLTEEDKAELQDALDRIAATRRRAYAKAQHWSVGSSLPIEEELR